MPEHDEIITREGCVRDRTQPAAAHFRAPRPRVEPDEALECLDEGRGDCEGPVEDRMTLNGTGRSFHAAAGIGRSGWR
jgi:hypothetical protein